jgi:hypothetical protein
MEHRPHGHLVSAECQHVHRVKQRDKHLKASYLEEQQTLPKLRVKIGDMESYERIY